MKESFGTGTTGLERTSSSCSFPTTMRRAASLLGVLIHLKIDSGNEEALLSPPAAFLHHSPSMCVFVRETAELLCCQVAA